MTETDKARTIEFHLKGEVEPLWVIRDSNVPLPDDLISIENADGTAKTYKVESRMWVTAKQGESSFARVSLIVKEIKPNTSWSAELTM